MGKSHKWQPADEPTKEKGKPTKPPKREIESPPAAPIRGFIRFMVICFAVAAAALVVVAAVARPGAAATSEPAVIVVTVTPNFYATTAAENYALATAQAAEVVTVNESVNAMATRTADEIAAVGVSVASVNDSLFAMGTAQAAQLEQLATIQAGELAMIATRTAENDEQITQAAQSITTLRRDIVSGVLWAAGLLLSFGLGAAVMSLYRRPLHIFPPTLTHGPQIIVSEPQPTQPQRLPEVQPVTTVVQRLSQPTPQPANFDPFTLYRFDATMPPTARERAVIRGYYHKLGSYTGTCKAVYGFKDGRTLEHVKTAVNEVLG